jgi:tetratricopeptide (TPR) repeat protein
MAKKRKRPHAIAEIPDESEVVYLTHYEITDSPIQDRRYRRLPDQIKYAIEHLYEKAQKKPLEAIPEITELIQKYPDLLMLYNYLGVAYARSGQKEAAEKVIEENFRRDPDYLFARLNYAEILLVKGELERVAEVFDNKFDLQMLYPNRKRFHISEATGFMGIVGWYFVEIGERETAEKYYEILKQIAPDHPMTRRLHKKLSGGWLQRLLSPKSDKNEAEADLKIRKGEGSEENSSC